jgi:ubiquinone/menaquinone biosynthesis C-methylase UbiE
MGSLVGRFMALKNAKRSRWLLNVLALQPGEAVLEVGFGSGADIQRALDSVGAKGRVAGVDVSEVMVRQATKRNLNAIRSERAVLANAGIDSLPFRAEEFDAAFSINCAQFWPDLAAGFREVHRVVRAGGRLLVAIQPRKRGATIKDSEQWLATLTEAALLAGWQDPVQTLGPTKPPLAVVALRKEAG